MVKSQRKTRKVRNTSAKAHSGQKMGLKKLRAAFGSMEKFVTGLKGKARHSFADAVSDYRDEWRRVFKRDISPADAAAYLKFRFGLKGSRAMTRRTKKMRGGAAAAALAGAPLDYQLRAGVAGTYGNFPTYQTQGLDRYYGNAMTADCGKPNGFPTDGSAASQKGGSWSDALFRPVPAAAPLNVAYTTMMETKGHAPYPTSDPVGTGQLRTTIAPYITNANMAPWGRSPITDIYNSPPASQVVPQ